MADTVLALRLSDEVKMALKLRAYTEGRNMRQVVNDALVAYLVTPSQMLAGVPELSADYPARCEDMPRRLIPRKVFLDAQGLKATAGSEEP